MSGGESEAAWPLEIKLARDRRALSIVFDDGSAFTLPAEYLRVRSPSAEVQGHSPAQRKTIGGKREVAITAVDPVGNYAVRLVFDDGHTTGIFSWATLYEMGRNQDRYWQEYLDELARAGLKRDASLPG